MAAPLEKQMEARSREVWGPVGRQQKPWGGLQQLQRGQLCLRTLPVGAKWEEGLQGGQGGGRETVEEAALVVQAGPGWA